MMAGWCGGVNVVAIWWVRTKNKRMCGCRWWLFVCPLAFVCCDRVNLGCMCIVPFGD